MHPLRLLSVAALASAGLALAGCGGSDEKYYIPVDHQIRPFVAPDEADLVGEDAEEVEPEKGGGAQAETRGAENKGASAAPAPAAAASAGGVAAKVPGKRGKPEKSGKSGGSDKSGKSVTAGKPGSVSP